ncbi:FAD-dependent monooxygenase [Umezawaea tangerina]|uniref:2-polyprenyl-6-methoxyphenol hydroxylase-like FAD-dependent oxidoreductase n=1 Tax=Umezawaea tangerina TaxID=84725 RepID=A0A2T0SNB7_9PSEU|nr:FAD-dependent monooxygenase [Umezawaea tangerina]PRY34886.1 2-polyprenyl-6-methoxyphenol hydroxylase-like FAD-dependent oxidoreductase [Umezawaea tangerina]
MSDPVVVAGGGPTGLLLACELRLAGVGVVVLERTTEDPEHSQGMAVHGRTLEALETRGLAERVRAQGIFPWPRTPFSFFWLDLADVGEQDWTFAMPQWKLLRVLRDRAAELGVDLRRGHELVGLEQDADGVSVTVAADGAEYALRGSYLVGADGPDSRVRSLAGIALPDDGSGYSGLLGDVVIADDDHETFDAGLRPQGIFGALPLQPGTLRLMTIEFGAKGPAADEPVTADELRDSIERLTGKRPTLREVRWLSRFGHPTAVADRYRSGRVLLAGDAAHVLFISGTQGLNTGLQDALNLGWKLAAEVQGRAAPGLLDSYEIERRAVGERVRAHALAQLALMHPLDRVEPLRLLFGEILELPEANRHVLQAATLTRYDLPHPGEQAHPLLGERIPNLPPVVRVLTEGRAALVDNTPGAAVADTAAAWKDRVGVVRDEEAAGIGAAVVLVRPDGHVAFADAGGEDLDGLRWALLTWFGDPVG